MTDAECQAQASDRRENSLRRSYGMADEFVWDCSGHVRFLLSRLDEARVEIGRLSGQPLVAELPVR